jgi:hypothetical protein
MGSTLMRLSTDRYLRPPSRNNAWVAAPHRLVGPSTMNRCLRAACRRLGLSKSRPIVSVRAREPVNVVKILSREGTRGTSGRSDAGWTRMVTSRLGPCSLVFMWRRRLRWSRRAGSGGRGRLRCQLGGRLSALSESARADGQQSSNRYGKNQRTHGVLPEPPTPPLFISASN